MTRAEVRRAEREKKRGEAVYHISTAELEKIKMDVTQDAVNKAIDIALALPILAIRDEFKFGEVRLQRVLDRVADLKDSMKRGYVSLDDLLDTLEEETGIRLGGNHD